MILLVSSLLMWIQTAMISLTLLKITILHRNLLVIFFRNTQRTLKLLTSTATVLLVLISIKLNCSSSMESLMFWLSLKENLTIRSLLQFTIDGNKFTRRDRTIHGGEVMMYWRIKSTPNLYSVEVLMVKLKIGNSWLMVCAV